MRTSPRRPLILKRRKLSLPQNDASSTSAEDKNNGQEHRQEDQRNSQFRDKKDCGLQNFPAGIEIIDHPTMPNTQVVAIPANADIQSIIEALTVKGKECGNNGPNKFILISSGGMSSSSGLIPSQHLPLEKKPSAATKAANGQEREKNVKKIPGLAGGTVLWHSGIDSSYGLIIPTGSGETTNSVLDDSLTNIQWLGKMTSDGLSPSSVKQGMAKENQIPLQERIKTEEDYAAASSPTATTSSWQDSVSERPPYSYMAMIQFAINSTEKKRMTLKDIYTWIENHFPYFKHVAKPGWKNSIRHNLSLHDMFVRETSANGKISFWTIHPDANRCLTLDQVFKPLDSGSPASPERSELHQKRHLPGPQKNMTSNVSSKTEPQNSRRKMKPLLPRINSYLVPIQFPLSQPLVLQPSVKVPLSMAQGASLSSSETFWSNKRVRIAPKMSLSTEDSSSLPMAAVKEESQCDEDLSSPTRSLKENSSQSSEPSFPENVCIKEEEGSQLDDWLLPFASTLMVKEETDFLLPVSSTKEKKQFTVLKSPSKGGSDTLVIKRREIGRSRRKQRLALPCSEEPVLVLPESSGFDLQEGQPLENVSQLSCSQREEEPFKTPVKEMFSKLPVSSTPSKVSITTTPPPGALDARKSASTAKGSHELDFSPVRTLQLPFMPLQENQDLLDFTTTPLKNPLESPWELLCTESSDMEHAPFTSSPAFIHESAKQSSVELPASCFTENRSLLEGLILDTMNDSLSKILLDVSFPGLEDENLGTDVSWSQLIPELK
ncbi:FOXM1 protein, partial [Indicator maculatus]|nr:FOXM1 protein [Indicator maculatus]